MIERYADPANAQRKYRYKAYKRDDVVAALEEMFGGKCAYCETFYGSGMPADVEHYRPKGAVMRNDGTLTRPGYYWLAAEWTNLLPSCGDCNRRRRQPLPGGTTQAGKANWFPLVDESRRATGPGGEIREQPLLLDPCVDAPDDHLAFGDEGAVQATTPRGEATITVLGLDRGRLTQDRHSQLVTVDVAIDRFRRAARRLDGNPDDAELQEELRLEADELRRLMDPGSRYAAMARQRIAAKLGDLISGS